MQRWFHAAHLIWSFSLTDALLAYAADASFTQALNRRRGQPPYPASTNRRASCASWALAAEDGLPDLMAGLQPPRVTDKLIPVFTGEELARLEQACAGRSFAQRRDTAIIAVFKATGIRLAELAGLRYDPGDPRRSDIDLLKCETRCRPWPVTKCR